MASRKQAVQSMEVRKEKDLNMMVKVMEAASAVRMQNLEASRQLDFDEVKEDLRKRILETSKVTGEQLADDEVDAAINSYLSGLYCFKEPGKGFAHSIANLYVDRKRIGKQYGIPALSIAGAGLFLWASTNIYGNIYRHSLERRIEKAVESSYLERQKLNNDAVKLSSLSSQLGEPDATETRGIANLSKERLNSTNEFFSKYCSDGTASDDINQQNYQEAATRLKSVDETLNKVEADVKKGKGIVDFNDNVVSTRQGLESLIEEIKNDNPPKPLMERGEAAYLSGIASLNNRQLLQGQNYLSELKGIKADVKEFVILPSQAEKLYSSIKSIAREDEALRQGEIINSEAQSYIKSVDVPHLRQSVDKLKDLDEVLAQEYSIRIVSKEGIKSGIDRYYTDKMGKRSSGYYLIVEAVDTKGNIVKKNITNEEDGKKEIVDMWGERVPEGKYEEVKSDKMDDGIIQNNIFGKKQKGYLDDKVTMDYNGKPLKREGQITRW